MRSKAHCAGRGQISWLGYNCLQFQISVPDDIPASPETHFELFSVQLSSFDFSFRTFEMLCQKGIFTVADLVQDSRQSDFFTIGLSGFDENSINEAKAFLRVLENEGHIQQNIEIDQISDDEIEADGQFETSEKTLNDFLNRPLVSMAWTENIDKVFSSLSMRTFGQLLDYSTTTLGREPYLTEADLG